MFILDGAAKATPPANAAAHRPVASKRTARDGEETSAASPGMAVSDRPAVSAHVVRHASSARVADGLVAAERAIADRERPSVHIADRTAAGVVAGHSARH